MEPAAYAPQRKKLPLLPYEKELIKLIGCSEEEYRFFATEAAKRGRTRPAEYDLVPDVRNDPVTILVNLAIGIALTAVSMLLAPKPGEPDQVENRQLAGKKGRNRFSQTFGFDSVAEIEAYGEAVAVPFGLYKGPETGEASDYEPHGGLVVAPKLVWSRMLSHGTNQALKCMYVVGERDMGTVLENSTWLGTTVLEGLYKNQYAIYWNTYKPGSTVGRITADDFRYGTRGTADAADTWNGHEVMVAPTHDGNDTPGFSMAYTPSGNTQFGMYSAIANGTERKADWRVISIPESVEDDDRPKAERKKISGNDDMDGAGRGYGRKMGIIEINGQRYSARTLVQINVGDTATFRLTKDGYDDIYDEGVTMDDLEEESIEERRRADDMLQVGEKFMFGQSMWVVKSRTASIWDFDLATVDIRLECINTLGDKTVGVVSTSLINDTALNEGGSERNNTNHVQANFYPLARAELATIRMQKQSEFIEFGIKSNVWGRANGLTYFPTTPSPEQLEEYDEDNVNLTTGQAQLYFTRYSYFQVQVRPAGASQGQEAFVKLPVIFGVRGSAPVDQYNYIRIQPGRINEEWEFRFVPICCAYITRNPQEAIILDAKTGKVEDAAVETQYGPFTLSAGGYRIYTENFETSRLTRRPGKKGSDPYFTYLRRPNDIRLINWNPNNQGKSHAWRWEILGDPSGLPDNTYRQMAITIEKPWNNTVKKVRVFIQASSRRFENPNKWGQYAVWQPHTYRVNQTHPDTINYAEFWNDGERCDYMVDLSANNPYRITVGNRVYAEQTMSVSVTQVWNPGTPSTPEVVFENDTAIAEVSHYGDSISRSCDDGPEHVLSYVNESYAEEDNELPQYGDMTTMGLVLRAGRALQQMDQPRCWVRRGIRVRNLLDFDGPEKSSNNFADLVYWILTDKRAGVGKYIDPSLIRLAQMQHAARFMDTNKLYFDGAIENRTNVRSLLYDLAPKFLCNFVIKNGQFGLTPALPTDDAGNIKGVKTPIAEIFSDGNIIEDTLNVVFLEAEERRDIQSVVQYRKQRFRELPEEMSVRVRWAGSANNDVENNVDMTQFCTTRHHAEMVAKYFLSIRRRIDHTISFKTVPTALYVGPGDYIKVFTQSSPYFSSRNGVIQSDRKVVAATEMPDGTYEIDYFQPGTRALESGSLTIVDGFATNAELTGCVFTTRDTPDVQGFVYQIEQLTLDEEGLVEITATYFPVDEQDVSLIAKDLFDESAFVTLP